MFSNMKTMMLDLKQINKFVDIDNDVWKTIIDKLVSVGIIYFVIKNFNKSHRELFDYLEKKSVKYIAICSKPFSFVSKKKAFFETTLSECHKYKKRNVLITINVNDLNLNVKKIFLENSFVHVIFNVENYCDTIHFSYWKNRTPIANKSCWLNLEDRRNLLRLSGQLIKNKEVWNIRNSIEYLKQIPNLGITQNWKCKYLGCFVVNNDSSISICEQKNFIQQMSIFDFGENTIDDRGMTQKMLKNMILTSQNCSGCFQVWKFDKDLLRNIYG